MLRDNEKSPAPRLLLVDDDRRLLDGYATYLTAMGYNCVARNNAGEAMAQFATGDFDLVITDLTMPDIDGIGILGIIRSHSDVPVLILTGHAFEYGRAFLGYDCVTVVQKPIEPNALMARVRLLLSQGVDPKRGLKCG